MDKVVLARDVDVRSAEPVDLPVKTSFQRWAWQHFLREAARRYGPNGGDGFELGEHGRPLSAASAASGLRGLNRFMSPQRRHLMSIAAATASAAALKSNAEQCPQRMDNT